jgi:demethylmenaquinone methyltransferase/2-methoxy-6-polyprenyl-1,4-benzoquinol methylase
VKTFRQRYYDVFSHFYDRFVRLHSRDRQEQRRALLADNIGLKRGDKILDVCTGTGTALSHFHEKVGSEGLIIGIDFSWGMLSVAQEKTSAYENVFLVHAEAGHLPFKARVLDAVTCSFAFYELKNETQDAFLKDARTVLKVGRPFFMIEHEVPSNTFVRLLFHIRLLSMGRSRAREILKHERYRLAGYFKSVDRIEIPTSKSKIRVCRN